ncbi:9781_t:CDS:2, partial [Diversispora eburnea]
STEFWENLLKWGTEQSMIMSNSRDYSKYVENLGRIIREFIRFIDFRKFQHKYYCDKVIPYRQLFEDEISMDVIPSSHKKSPSTSNKRKRIRKKLERAKRQRIELGSDPSRSILINQKPVPSPSILINQKHISLISSWIANDTKDSYKLKLLLRASIREFLTRTFHRRCDNKGPTLTIIKVLGSQEILEEKIILSRVQDSCHAIYQHKDYGPSFGRNGRKIKQDLRMVNRFNLFPKQGFDENEEWFKYDLKDGGGMCSLAGLIIAAKCNPKNVTLTDGNPNYISIKKMLWDLNTAYNDTYDVVICADCTFDKSTHPHLLHVLKSIIKKPLPNNNSNYYSDGGRGGLFILCAPNRGDSLNAFIKLIESLEKDLKIELLVKYDDIVWNIHENNLNDSNNYDPDTHYPLILKIYWRY